MDSGLWLTKAHLSGHNNVVLCTAISRYSSWWFQRSVVNSSVRRSFVCSFHNTLPGWCPVMSVCVGVQPFALRAPLIPPSTPWDPPSRTASWVIPHPTACGPCWVSSADLSAWCCAHHRGSRKRLSWRWLFNTSCKLKLMFTVNVS